ncbi:chloramphenicol resistance protein, partial [Clostridium perfringens]
SYGPDIINNLNNINFYENLVSWLEEKNRTGDLPILDGNREVEKIEILTPGYAFQTDIDKARYQIQLRLIYIERK